MCSFSRSGLQTAQLPLLPVWEKGVGAMRGKRASGCPNSPFSLCARRGRGDEGQSLKEINQLAQAGFASQSRGVQPHGARANTGSIHQPRRQEAFRMIWYETHSGEEETTEPKTRCAVRHGAV